MGSTPKFNLIGQTSYEGVIIDAGWENVLFTC